MQHSNEGMLTKLCRIPRTKCGIPLFGMQDGQTPLIMAVRNAQKDLVELLLKRGANTEYQTKVILGADTRVRAGLVLGVWLMPALPPFQNLEALFT